MCLSLASEPCVVVMVSVSLLNGISNVVGYLMSNLIFFSASHTGSMT